MSLTFGSFFSGIGGFEIGLERAGMKCKWQVEIDDFAQSVLTKHWPDIPTYRDITKVSGKELHPVDVFVGGFPCQDISIGGEQAGIYAKRSGLFWDLNRIIRVVRPQFVLLENVSALLSVGMADVISALSESGYDAEWDCLPSVAFGAPHQRDRVFVLAYSKCSRLQRPVFAGSLRGIASQAPTEFGNRIIACGHSWRANSASLRMGDGVPLRVARRHVKAFGNAVVPQVAQWLGERIIAAHEANA